jgi:5-formyltetrahydrofolate cyclo-ligase
LTDSADHAVEETVSEKKEKLRNQCVLKRKSLTDEERKDKSAQIVKAVLASDEFARARAIMLYASTRTEVQTDAAIREMVSLGKRVILPYCKSGGAELGIGEITDPAIDLVAGEYNLREPRTGLRDNFLKSDLHLVVCPGVAFDMHGGRLGRGKGYYDLFLKDLTTRIPIFGVAYACQMLEDPLPFDYHDIPVDALFTENGRMGIVR